MASREDMLVAGSCALIILSTLRKKKTKAKKRSVWIKQWIKRRSIMGAHLNLIKELQLSITNYNLQNIKIKII